MAVFLFYGQEEYLMEKEIKKLKNELLDASFMSMSYKVFDNPDFNTLMDCVQSAPLMFGNTLTIINIEKYLIGNKMSLDDKQIDSVNYALSNLSDNVNIIFVCKISRDESKKPDSRKKLYKTLSKYSQVREFAQYRSYDKQLQSEILKMAKEKDLTISSDNVSFLIEQLGVNLTLIDSELEKLKIAIYPNKSINQDAIKKYCTSSEDVFILADLIIQGNKNEILKQYDLLTEKRHPLEIFSVLQSNFQRFVFVKNYEKKMSTKDIASKLKLHEFVVMKMQEKLRKISLDKLLKIRENLINAEYKLKTGQSASSEILLELTLLR
ncbi:TPA: DNA polymerase III subunit delta [Candidatus Avigastranaerophilus faecigallinarum]|nr:DNA polymerase III subunit delta [Candidatus Avigastranaerophilus faecigallinarum]